MSEVQVQELLQVTLYMTPDDPTVFGLMLLAFILAMIWWTISLKEAEYG